jgi:hypothetical protein
MTAREKVDAAKAIYASAGKSMARAVVMGAAAAARPATILDLWGGGKSAEAFREAVPDATIMCAERDEEMWPLLVHDAQRHGYAYHLGDAADAPGTYDLVWLDLCAQASRDTERVIRAVSAKVNRDGLLFITLMPARERDRVLTGEQRLLQLPLWLEGATGSNVRMLLPYRRDNDLPMWLVGLRRGGPSAFRDVELFETIKAALISGGYWNGGIAIGGPAVDLLDAFSRTASRLGADPDFERYERRDGSVVRLNSLDPTEQKAILALIDAHAAARRAQMRDAFGLD